MSATWTREAGEQPDQRVVSLDAVGSAALEIADPTSTAAARTAANWRAIVDEAPSAVAVFGADGTFLYANLRALALYAIVDLDSVIGRSVVEFIAPPERNRFRGLFASVLRGERLAHHRCSVRAESGRIIDVELSASLLESIDGSIVEIEFQESTSGAPTEVSLRDAERRWRAVFASSPVGIGVSDATGCLVEANDALCRLLGRELRDILGHMPAEFALPDEAVDTMSARTGLAFNGDGALRVVNRYLRPDGEIRWAWLTASLMEGDDGRPWTIAYLEDITERKASEETLLDFETNLAAVAGVVRQIQGGGDARQIIVNAAVVLAHGHHATLLEPSPDGLTLHVTASTEPSHLAAVVPLTRASVTAKAFNTGQTVFTSRAAQDPATSRPLLEISHSASLAALPVRSAAGVTAVLVVGWSTVVESLDERRAGVLAMLADQAGVALRQIAMVAALEDLALTDSLTGIPNRRSWEQLLGLLIAGARRSGRPLTVALCDLDHFKNFNDGFGHHAGDVLLREFASGAHRRLREGDVIARWGGEEFALALPECGVLDAPAILERVRRAVPSEQTCSIGYAEWDGRESAASLMERIDQALYRAKDAGRDQIASAEATPSSK